MQRHHELKTEDVLLMLNEDDPYPDGDRDDSVVVSEVEATQSRHLPNRSSVLVLVAMVVVVSEAASREAEVVASVAGSEVTEVTEVGMVEEEVSAMIEEVIGVDLVTEEALVVARLLMLRVDREEEVGSEDTKTDAMGTEEVGMGVGATEVVQAATETR